MIALGVLALSAALSQASTPPPAAPNPCYNIIQNVWDPRFTPGQRWSYHPRPVDEGSTLIITKIDQVPGIGLVVQVDVSNVDYMDIPMRYKINIRTEHIAIRRDSLNASVLQMVGIRQLPYDSGFYAKWQSDCVGRTVSTSVTDTITALQAQFCAENVRSTSIPACKQPPKPAPTPPNPASPTSTPPSSAQPALAPIPTPTPSDTTAHPSLRP
jgi:hypothetical protein